MKLKDRLGKHPVLIITTICVICVAVIAGFTAHIELQRYEDGILDVCATQQDAYVQLVLDKINLKDNRNDEKNIFYNSHFAFLVERVFTGDSVRNR